MEIKKESQIERKILPNIFINFWLGFLILLFVRNSDERRTTLAPEINKKYLSLK